MKKQSLKEVRKWAKKNGFVDGEIQKAKEIAKKMKQENIEFDLIIKVTGLSKEEIENL